MKKTIKRILFSIAAAAVAAVCLLCGCINGTASSSFGWVVDTIKKNYYIDIPEDEILYGIMEGGVGSVLDIYSGYYTAKEYDEIAASNAGRRTGIGVSYQYVPKGASERGSGILISSVVGGSPAYRSGLKAGSFVTAVKGNGIETSVNSSADFSEAIGAQPDGEKFTLVTDRGEFEMSFEEYNASYCRMCTKTGMYSIDYNYGGVQIDEGGIADLPQGAAYIKLDQFYGKAVSEFASLMEQYNALGCTSLILDLRQDGGGYVDVMQGISGIFTGELQISGNVAMSAIYKDGKKQDFDIHSISGKERRFPAGHKLSVLADNGTASASEALIGVLISYGVMDYSDVYVSDFGESYLYYTGTEAKNRRTYGKGIMQSTFKNGLTGEVLKLTTAKIYWPNGVCIHDVGLSADSGEMKCNAIKTDWAVTYEDEQLSEAIKLIYG